MKWQRQSLPQVCRLPTVWESREAPACRMAMPIGQTTGGACAGGAPRIRARRIQRTQKTPGGSSSAEAQGPAGRPGPCIGTHDQCAQPIARLELARADKALYHRSDCANARSVYYLVLSSYIRNVAVDRYRQICALYNSAGLSQDSPLVIYQRWRWPLVLRW